MSYELYIGRHEEGHFGDEDKDIIRYRGRLDELRELEIPSLEIAHQIASLCNIKSYIIFKYPHNWGNESVFATPDIIEWDNQKKTKREKNIKDEAEHCARINKLPTKYDYGTIVGHTLTFERTKAEYDPRRSGKVQWNLYIRFLKIGAKPSNDHMDNLYPTKYRSTAYGIGSGRKRLHKRFEQDFRRTIEDQAQRDKLWDELPKIEARYDEIKRQIENA